MTQAYKQIANSVPIPVIKAIALEMKKLLDYYYKLNSGSKVSKKASI